MYEGSDLGRSVKMLAVASMHYRREIHEGPFMLFGKCLNGFARASERQLAVLQLFSSF